MADYWLNAPTFAPLDAPAGGTLRPRNQRLSDLLGNRPAEVTYEQNVASMRDALDKDNSGPQADDGAVGTLGVTQEGE